jgi:hypothetical protein
VTLLAEEQQVAGTGTGNVASHKVGVLPPQGFGVGKLGESAVRQVIGGKAALAHAKQART